MTARTVRTWVRWSAATRTATPAIVLSFALAGCGLPFEAQEELIANTCESDADCPDGACTSVNARQLCVATQADLAGVIFQLEGTTRNGALVSHVFSKGYSIQGESDSGTILDVGDLDVPAPFALSGRLLQPGDPVTNCTGDDGSVPVKMEARPTSALAGLNPIFTGISELLLDPEDGLRKHRFRIDVPAGIYDVYVAPQPLPAGCAAIDLPPALFSGIEVEGNVPLEPLAEVPKRLKGVVISGPDRDLAGFTVELVDPVRGVPLSAAVMLGPAINGESQLLGGPNADDEEGIAYYSTPRLLLRLSEPDGALVVHWDFESLDLDGDGEVKCNLDDLIANPKDLTAKVVDEQTRAVPGATVTIKSRVLTGSASENGSFRVTATTGADGNFNVQLIPGIYQVLVVPPGEDGPAVLDANWEISPDAGCCGKGFPLPARSLLTALVSTPLGDPASSVSVVASPSLPGTSTYFQNVIESLELLPRQSTTSTSNDGTFRLTVDSGLYDLTVRAASSTGFPWLVRPSVLVADVSKEPVAKLEDLVVPSPALFIGRATAQGVDVAGGTLRAYLPLADGSTQETSPVRVIQIGETIVGADGRFVLPVPPTVARVIADEDATSSSSASSSATGTF